ncbi:hypothetical protein SUGI_0681360 [Cryptomeria japonica]|uniref:aspartyl protease family protein 2-like n=1 Tax=Cryptomeria japonica TaxID=3369 RepID=UPI0024147C2F|nr:aspartyl protease family protein 2-like [Cryptomeria japonica]GLJ33872.1 hypothetical protein SUGI_0681360 [Cryptomeria japonica]
MAMNKQALLFALSFLLSCFLRSPSCECGTTEEKYYMVGMNTFLIEEARNFNASTRSPSGALAFQEIGRGGADLLITHLNVASNSSWRDVLTQGLQRDKHLVNRILTHNARSSPLGTNAFSTPVTSGRELQGPEYTVAVSIGTPAQKQLMGIDTLISLSWIQCNPCKDCSSNAKLPMYVPKQSSSYRSVSCKLSKCPPLGSDPKDFESKCDNWDTCTYRDTNGLAQGSEGDYITETLQVGDNTLNELHMGCAYSFTPRREYATSGHLGLGRGPLSLVSQKAGGQFSYCLPNYLSLGATGSLSLGKYSVPSSVKVFTPMQKEPQFASSAYILGLEGISVGGQRLSVNMQVPGALPTITYIDTAIMATQLVKPLYDALRSSFEEKMKTYAPAVQPAKPFGEFKPCYQLSNITSVKIPTVTLHFKGNANFDVPAVGTLLQVANDVVCFPFQQSPNDAVKIIGNVQQQGITVAYDNVNNRIGFGPGSC